jgi:transcriptional regulatory protein AMDR
VVDEERFMAQYRARDASDPPSLLLLQTVLLVGAHVSPGHALLKVDFFRRAKILIDSRFERNRDVIVQSALLLTWYSDGAEDVAANAWYWIGFAARTAMGLGMHRDAESSNLVDHNKKMWRRVWWLLVQCDLLISLQYGRPLAM